MASKESRFNISALQFLVVDGDAAMRQTLIAVLRSMGVQHILEANDGEAALGILDGHCPDIIFSEWELPKINGIDLTKKIRGNADSLHRMTPIIFVTAHTQVRHVTAARDAGVTEFLAKPFSARRIYSRICTVLERPRPFIEAETFTGPDRRRKRDPYLVGRAMRASDKVKSVVPMHGAVTEDELDAMLGL